MKYKNFIINSDNSFFKNGQFAAVAANTQTGQIFKYDNFYNALQSIKEMASQTKPANNKGKYNLSFNAGSLHGVYNIDVNKPSIRACLDLVSGWLVSGYKISNLTIKTA